MIIHSGIPQLALIVPQGKGRARAYLGYRVEADYRVRGEAGLPRFIEECVRCGIPQEFYVGSRAAGPLATFNGADNWVAHPYASGIALIGDAAATSDPTTDKGWR
jgi:hypothetical protein